MSGVESNRLKLDLYVPIFYPWVLHLRRSLQKQGHSVNAYTSGIYGNYPGWKKMQEDITVLPSRVILGDRLLKFKVYFTFFKNDPDLVILSGTESSASLILAFLANLKNVPVLLIVEENRDVRRFYSFPVRFLGVFKKILIKMIHRNADILIPETEASKNYLVKMGCDVRGVQIAPHGIDISEFKPGKPDYDFAKTLGLKKSKLRSNLNVLYAGGYYEHKGIDVITRIIDRNLLDDNIVIFIPEFGENIDKYHSKFTGKANIVLMPLLDNDDLKKLYLLMDVVLIPSISGKSTERSPNVLIEALATGRTVIASDTGGIPTIMGDAGILVKENNENELAQAINKISNNKGYLITNKKKARAHAENVLNADVYGKIMIDNYYSFIGKSGEKNKGGL